ncbi:class I SAM-dependent methyltransferase [Ruegeria sp. Alg231-54]|uniref:class I SAM-dependent methyltransferase n=1 Tax=Ruegeria sp. Alg231-54 TaxID=1922221 RepID=UPI000D554695|nr:class I SAM-dependent methyltransferase [Ruegeria sp. Alg231-54]
MAKRVGRLDKRSHWEQVYETNHPRTVSWFQPEPTISIQLVQNSGVKKTDAIIDVGGGASTFVDCLQAHGYKNLTVLDVSSAAIGLSQKRIGKTSRTITWYVNDITAFEPPHSGLVRRTLLERGRAVA